MNRDLTRREVLLGGSVAVGALTRIGDQTLLAADGKQDYIDAHSHIWTPAVDRFPLKAGVKVDDLAPRSFTAEELLALANPLGVRRVVLIAHTLYYGVDNSYLVHAAQQFPGVFRVVGMIDDRQPHPDRQMRDLHGQGVTGFRITPSVRGKAIWLDNPGMATMWRCAGETGQAMCCLIDAHHLAQVDEMCVKFPDTRVVIDHFARIGVDGTIREADVDTLCRLARHPHTHVKISAFYALGRKEPPYHDLIPMIRRVHEAFGAERVMWASDSPYQVVGVHSYAASLALVRDELEFLSAGDREWLLRKTAESVYFAS
jgi:predicted TIM-barrel fold metal-dependent hydrolase